MVQPPRDTTGGLWEFAKYFLDQQGPQNVPQKFLKSARWEDKYRNSPGYYTVSGSFTVAVEFNSEHLCWTETRYRRTERQWHIHKIAADDLGLNIHLDELTPDEIILVMGGSNSSTPSTLTGQQIRERVKEAVMSQTTDLFETKERMSKDPLKYFGEPLDQFPKPNVLTDEENREMLTRFPNPEDAQVRATQMETATTTSHLQPNLWANPQTATIQHAARENPPQGSGGGGDEGSSGGGRGSRGGGGGRGGRGGGNPPGPPRGHVGGGGENRLFGQPPDIFTGDRSKTKEFLTQWELYYNLNHLSNIMGVPYSRCMLFLTFCKGPLIATWASTIAHDISNRARQPGIGIHDKRLWTHMADSFC